MTYSPAVTPRAILDATLTITQLCVSPLNQRTDRRDIEATGPLEASILKRGLIQPLAVHRMRGSKDRWGTFAGQRRYHSLRKLIERGALPADCPISVRDYVGYSDAEIIELSLAENGPRRDLQDYERYAGVRRAHTKGHSVEQIAEALGQEPALVRRWLRVGQLARPIFEALADDRISVDQAKAFAATADEKLQLEAWEALSAGPEHARTAAAIRAWLRIDDRETGKLLRFVGEEAYQAAGGAFEVDLFADGADRSGRVTDEPLLRRLADAKVGGLRDATRARVNRPDLRFAPQPPRNPEYGGNDSMLFVSPGGPDENELPEGDVVAVITIPDTGEAEVSFWWSSRKAVKIETKAAARPPRPAARIAAGAAIGQQDALHGYRQKADALIKEDAGLTQEGTQILRSLRRAILRAALVQGAREGRDEALDYLVWAQLRMRLSRAGKYGQAERPEDVGMRPLSSSDPDGEPALAQIEASEAGRTWAKAIDELQGHSFLTEPDLAAAFLDYRNAPAAVRRLAAAVVAGVALERSLDAEGYRIPVHDALAVQARVAHVQGLRHWWQPTATFLDLLPTSERRAIVEPFVDETTYASWAKYKSAELTPLVLRVVLGTAPSTRKMQQVAAAQWVHPLLRFRIDAGVRPAEPVEQQEAAE